MTVITNVGENTLSNKAKEFLKKSYAMDALVGYFYFSGFQNLYEELKDKKVKILVGMDIDRNLIEKISSIDLEHLENYTTSQAPLSRSSMLKNYLDFVAAIFNDTDEFDSNERIEAFEVFLKKLKDGTLEIKKTPERNHSKVYIFHFKEEYTNNGDTPGIIIEGSSNLSRAGLVGQRERNRVLTEKHYYEEEIEEFEQLWSNPDNIDIVNADTADHFIKEIKKRIWPYQLPSPELLYYRVLDEYYSHEEMSNVKLPEEITNGKFINLQYQKDAIERGIDRIERFGGVIIADVVGLGKSIIASAIAHNLNLQTIIIAPPHLKTQWEDYKAEFNLNAHIYTTGEIEKALNRHENLNHELLIILDEAHKHRNEDTKNYKLLHQLCAGNKVMALTATPFNNDPKDIYALIKLFTTPGKSTIKTVENLSIAFHDLFRSYKKARKHLREASDSSQAKTIEDEIKKLSERLRMMISPLVIRRSRLDLMEIDDYREDLKTQGIEFSDVEEPEALEYELGNLSEQYLNTLETISPEDEKASKDYFNAVRYKPAAYLKENSKFLEKLVSEATDDDEEKAKSAKQRLQQLTLAQTNISKFMRRLLVRRFESSVEAFRKSLDNMIRSAEIMVDWYENRKVVPIYKKANLPDSDSLKKFQEEDPEEFEKFIEKLEGKGLIQIPVDDIEPSFIVDLHNDINVLRRIQEQWENVPDIKFDQFVETLKKLQREDKQRKIIVFSEFADTVEYLNSKLQSEHPELRVFKYTAKDSNKRNKQIILENFDAGFDKRKQKDEYDILIATDAISEGFNLHRAGVIINYDIPYNPTKVIQRVGRINRINKKVFKTLHIYNFFPSFTGESEIRSKAIAIFKKKIIDALLGDDTKIFTEDEELQNFFAEEYRREKAKLDEASWDSKYYNDWRKLKHNRELLEKVRNIPHRVRIGRESNREGVLVFAKHNHSSVFAFGETPEQAEVISPEIALPMFNGENLSEEKPIETTTNFAPIYEIAKKHIFKDNTIAKIGTRTTRKNALQKVKLLGEKNPIAKEYAKDVEKIIAEYDALPTATLKEITEIKISEDPERAFEKMKEILPISYIDKIMETARRADDTSKIVLLSEEFIRSK